MERRKVIQQGKGTLTMSLPMVWVKNVGLSAGDEVFVESRGLQLLISPAKGERVGKSSDVDLSGLSQGLVCTVLNNLYVRGDDEFRLRFDTPELYEAIVDNIGDLIGFEIVEQTQNSCVVKELAKGVNEDFDTLVRRIFLLLLSMAEDGVIAFKLNDANLLRVIEKREIRINTLVAYCLRVLNKKGGADVYRSMHLYTLLTLMEELGDYYQRLYRDTKTLKGEALTCCVRVARLLRSFYELFYTFEKKKASELKAERDAIRDQINTVLEKTRSRDDIIALHHVRSIADLIMDIAKFNLGMQI